MKGLMTKKWFSIPFVTLAIVLAGYVVLNLHQTVWALSIRDVEVTFHVIEKNSGRAIPKAEMIIKARNQEDYASWDKLELQTDDHGQAKILRKGIFVDELNRPFHRTIAEVDTTWCEFDIKAPGYLSIERKWLAEYRYHDNGYDSNSGIHKVSITIPLYPIKGKCRWFG